MAGKSKTKGTDRKGNHNDASSVQSSTPRTPKTSKGLLEGPLKGHLGTKSSPFSPTDSKLISQYMVLDHMTAHYKNLNKSKACVDTTPPKAWLVSQKVRDRVRRESLKKEFKRRDSWLASHQLHGTSSSRASSEMARDEMFAMMQGLTVAEGFDDVDFAFKKRDVSNTTLEAHASESDPSINASDMQLVNRIVNDSAQSPSQYHSTKKISSNIPKENGIGKKPGTPRSSDLIDSQKHKYTEEKPFTPRTLKTNGSSKIQDFKYYNPPKRRAPKTSSGPPIKSNTMVMRPETPMTADSGDLMNETLMSRDLNHMRSPSGVPPLDISLDADHMNWLQEQSKRGKLRSSVRSEAGSEMSSYRLPADARRDLLEEDLKHTAPATKAYTLTGGLDREEELKYLEFVTDVTNDVLDRGIFTNRVLKSVFETHLEKKKHELKVSKMREMLDDLRRDLGIPIDDSQNFDNVGISSTRTWSPEELLSATKNDSLHSESQTTPIPNARSRRMANLGNNDLLATHKTGLPTLRLAKRGGEGKPPLPHARPVSRGSRSRPGSSCSRTDLQDVKEVSEEHDGHLLRDTHGNGQDDHLADSADILQIHHDELEGGATLTNGHLEEDDVTHVGKSVTEDPDETTIDDNDDTALGLDDTLHAQMADYCNAIGDKNDVDSKHESDGEKEEEAAEGGQQVDDGECDEDNYGYESDFSGKDDADDEDEMDQEPESVAPPLKPTPRKRSTTPLTPYQETPRSLEQTVTSDSIDISELDEDDLTY